MINFLKYFIIICMFSLVSCAGLTTLSGRKINPINIGYTQQQVVQAWGRPDAVGQVMTPQGTQTVWTYTCVKMLPDTSWGIVPCYQVVFTNGVVSGAVADP